MAGGAVSATTGGAWVSFRTGLQGGALELAASDLLQVAPAPGLSPARHPLEATQGVTANVSDGVLWVTSAQSLSCADPSTGEALATEAFLGAEPVLAAAGMAYVAGRGIVVLTPPPVCWSHGLGDPETSPSGRR